MFKSVETAILENIVLSVLVVGSALVLRWAVEIAAVRKASGVEARRRRFAIRSVANILLALALLALWMSQIQTVVFSLAAVMVALVIATKELIMCAAGAILRFGGHLFRVGDRIEVAGLHGEVIDHGLFSTTVMELPRIGEGVGGTGRTLMLPNSVFLTGPVRVEAQPRQYAPHRFTLTLETPMAVTAALDALERVLSRAGTDDRDRAARFHRLSTHKLGAEVAGPEPHVGLTTSELGKLQFHVMTYCLVQDAAALEKAITLGFLTEIDKLAGRTGVPAAAANASAPAAASGAAPWEALARELAEPPVLAGRGRQAA